MRQLCSNALLGIALVFFAPSALAQPPDPAVELGAPPRFPPGALEATRGEASALSAGGAAAAVPLGVATADRAAVAAFCTSVYLASEGVAAGWTGNHAGCVAGTTSQAYKDATLLRLNYYRAMGGLPGNVVLDASLSSQAQSAALIMSAQGALSHDPPSSWACYSAVGADAAGHSNIALGIGGPDAIRAYMGDSGANNSAVGYRRWILYPPQTTVGTGSIPAAAGKPAANAQDAVAWLMNGGTVAGSTGLGEVDAEWQIAGLSDFNGGGKSDVLWRHSGGSLSLWLMNGGTATSVLELGTVDPTWVIQRAK